MSSTNTTTKSPSALHNFLPALQILATIPYTLELFYITYMYFSAGPPYNVLYYLEYWFPTVLASFGIIYLAAKHAITLRTEVAKSAMATWVYMPMHPLWWWYDLKISVVMVMMVGMLFYAPLWYLREAGKEGGLSADGAVPANEGEKAPVLQEKK